MTPADAEPPDRAREDSEFSNVYRTHAAFIWRCLRRLGVRDGDVEDVCQETFMIAHRKFDQFDGSSAIRSWLFGIARRKASEYRRRRQVRLEQPTGSPPDQVSAAEQHDHLELHRARARLDEMLAELDDDKRAVFVLYELEQLPMTEVAEHLGCPLQTAYSRAQAARRQMQTLARRFQLKGGAL